MGAGKALDRMKQGLGSGEAGRAFNQRELGGPMISVTCVPIDQRTDASSCKVALSLKNGENVDLTQIVKRKKISDLLQSYIF